MTGSSRAIAALLLIFTLPFPAAAQSIVCNTDGDFGAVDTEATIVGVHSLAMDTTGAITYPAGLSGPALGTPVTCTLSGFAAAATLEVSCDATRTITNAGGCCGTQDRDMTAFTVTATGGTTLSPVACAGLGTSVGTFDTTGGGTGTITIGATMDATHVRTGDGYSLSASGPGPGNVQVKDGSTVTGPAQADFSVSFASLVAFSATDDMAFGKISFTGAITGASHVDLGTDGSAAYAGNFSAGNSTLSPGQVTMSNTHDGVTLEVYCDASATLTRAGGGAIDVTGIKVAPEGSTGSYAGAGSACNGSGGAAATTMVYAAGTADQFFFGGVLDGGTAASLVPGAYSSANGGGASIDVIVLNQ